MKLHKKIKKGIILYRNNDNFKFIVDDILYDNFGNFCCACLLKIENNNYCKFIRASAWEIDVLYKLSLTNLLKIL